MARPWIWLAFAAISLAGCDDGEPSDGDADVDGDADGDGGGDADSDSDRDQDGDADDGGQPWEGVIGAPCHDDGDCLVGECYRDVGWIEGYCVYFDCAPPLDTCGPDGICVPDLFTDGTRDIDTCMGSCEIGCRPGYACSEFEGAEFCSPSCDPEDDRCPGGSTCRDVDSDPASDRLRCVVDFSCSPARPVDGECPLGEICQDGECVEFECDDTMHEPNETREAAVAIDAPAEALQICGGDDDWFEVTPDGEGILLVGIASEYGSGDLNVDESDIIPTDYNEEHPDIRGPLGFEGYTLVAAPSAETIALHVFGVRGAENNYGLVYRTIPYEDGPDCLEAGFDGLECSGFDADGGFETARMIMFPVSHAADSYVGPGFIFEAGHTGELITTSSQYLRRDLVMALRHAMHVVQETYPGTQPLGIGEGTMPDGTTPWGHPYGTHYYGSTVDIAYFIDPEHIGSWGNMCYRQICYPSSPGDTSHVGYTTTGVCEAGSSETHIVDVPRTALLMAELAATGLLRVYGMDPAPEADLDEEYGRLEAEGHPGAAAARRLMATADDDSSWVWHWHHIHVALTLPRDPGFPY
jgi:hypothetical protein